METLVVARAPQSFASKERTGSLATAWLALFHGLFYVPRVVDEFAFPVPADVLRPEEFEGKLRCLIQVLGIKFQAKYLLFSFLEPDWKLCLSRHVL